MWIDEAINAIQESSEKSSVYVGTASLVYTKNGVNYAKYSTVIVLHIDSSRGCKLFHHSETHKDFGNLKQRMLMEVGLAVEAASSIIDHIGNRHMELHIDVSPDESNKSSVAVKEAVGWVRGTLGIEPKIKPDAWAASKCSDHIVRGRH